jgi:PAS domain S-box-containing protein
MQLLAPLPPVPPSVGRARQLVADALEDAGREELLDLTLLLTSEVVTNAVLHARSELELWVEIGPDVVHVAVADHSPALPTPRRYDEHASTGRGLGLIAQIACDHGVDRIEGDGKVVWFEVRAGDEPEIALDPDALLETWDLEGLDDAVPAVGEARDVELRGIPVHLYRATRQHDDALLREHTLMEGPDAWPNGPPLDLSVADEAVRSAVEAGRSSVDVVVPGTPAAAEGARALLDVLARADELAAAGEMLTPSALPEVRWCRVWQLEEIARQVAGAAPRPWSPIDVQHRDTGAALHLDPMRVLDALGHAVVVGDEENRIVFANKTVEDLLGWACGDLVGKRLTVLVPERLRERHLAGYTRMLVGDGTPRILGRPVRVPALHRDGSEVPVELLIAQVQASNGRPAFVACMRALGG